MLRSVMLCDVTSCNNIKAIAIIIIDIIYTLYTVQHYFLQGAWAGTSGSGRLLDAVATLKARGGGERVRGGPANSGLSDKMFWILNFCRIYIFCEKVVLVCKNDFLNILLLWHLSIYWHFMFYCRPQVDVFRRLGNYLFNRTNLKLYILNLISRSNKKVLLFYN